MRAKFVLLGSVISADAIPAIIHMVGIGIKPAAVPVGFGYDVDKHRRGLQKPL